MDDKPHTAQILADQLASEAALAVYFSSEGCSVCKDLYPRIERMLAEEYPRFALLRIKADEEPELAAQMGVLSVPTLLIYLDHRELRRYVRQLGVSALREDLQRPYSLLFD